METARTLKERLFLPGVLVVFLRMASFSTVTSAGKIMFPLNSSLPGFLGLGFLISREKLKVFFLVFVNVDDSLVLLGSNSLH